MGRVTVRRLTSRVLGVCEAETRVMSLQSRDAKSWSKLAACVSLMKVLAKVRKAESDSAIVRRFGI